MVTGVAFTVVDDSVIVDCVTVSGGGVVVVDDDSVVLLLVVDSLPQAANTADAVAIIKTCKSFIVNWF